MFALILSVGKFALSSRPDAETRADTWVCPYGGLKIYSIALSL